MTTTLTVKTIAVLKATILFIIISIAFEVDIVYADSKSASSHNQSNNLLNVPSGSKQITAFVYEPVSSRADIERNPSGSKAEIDEYMVEVKNSLLKDFVALNKQLNNVEPENANKILSTVMKIRIVKLDENIDDLESDLTILNWKEKFMFTKKSKLKVKTKISSMEKELAKSSKERFFVQKLLTESELKEGKTDNNRKINREIDSF